MRYIGNILTNGVKNYSKFFNVVSERENLIDGIPTLVIGWEFTVSAFKEEKTHGLLDITDWEIDKNTFWTFSKREKNFQMVSDLEKFTELAVGQLMERIRYSFFNILTASRAEKSMFWQEVKSANVLSCFLLKGMVYLWKHDSDSVVGISLRDIDYCGGNPKKTMATLHSLNCVEFVKIEDDVDTEVKNIIWKNPYLGAYLLAR